MKRTHRNYRTQQSEEPNAEVTCELLQEMEQFTKQEMTNLTKFVTVASAGITRLIMLQRQRYCYIKL